MSKKITFNKMTIVSYAAVNAKNDVCLCSRQLTAPTLDDLKKCNTYVIVQIGECGHAYHRYCIEEAAKSNGKVCPKCNTKWDVKYEINPTPKKEFKEQPKQAVKAN